ncbi:hypothetical protein S83_022060 [Arachis hypogaea]
MLEGSSIVAGRNLTVAGRSHTVTEALRHLGRRLVIVTVTEASSSSSGLLYSPAVNTNEFFCSSLFLSFCFCSSILWLLLTSSILLSFLVFDLFQLNFYLVINLG